MSLTSLVAEQHVVLEASEKDFDALNRLITHSTVIKNEQPEDRSFDDVIFKPWGNEARVYVDNFYDLWLLRINEGERTSLHSHARKLTQLLCLSGVGVVTSLNGGRLPLHPGRRRAAVPHRGGDPSEQARPRASRGRVLEGRDALRGRDGCAGRQPAQAAATSPRCVDPPHEPRRCLRLRHPHRDGHLLHP